MTTFYSRIIPAEPPEPVTVCQKKFDNSNGQDWWTCDRCGSTWHELVQGRSWLPLSCPDRSHAR